MESKKQKKAAKKNIKKAQKKWQSMSSRQRSLAQPEGKDRARPGARGGGDYYRVVVRDKNQFTSFRYHDVGEDNGDLQRLAGRRSSGSWATQAWLISKKSAHMDGETLVGENEDVKDLLDELGSKPKHVKGDIFEAKPRKNIPEKDKPTKAQQRARQENIKKAQQARRDEQ
jgi:hypothetical protein